MYLIIYCDKKPKELGDIDSLCQSLQSKKGTLKEQYIKFCAHTEGLTIFMQPWFLDAVCGSDKWAVCMDIAKSGEVNGVLVYHFGKKWGFNMIKMPLLTPYMGLWIKTKKDGKFHEINSQERSVLTNLISQLPQVSYSSQSYPPNFMNWLPFNWANYQHQLKVTHVVENLGNSDSVFDNFKENTQKKIRKVSKTICIEKSDDPQIVYDIYTKIQKRYGEEMSYSLSFLEILHQEIQKSKAGQLYIAKSTEDGKIHAALYIVWDSTSAYYWLGGSDEEFRNSGALTFLIWEIMKDVAKRGICRFDFTGSSMQNLETYFTSFGACKVPYLNFNRFHNRFLALLHFLMR